MMLRRALTVFAALAALLMMVAPAFAYSIGYTSSGAVIKWDSTSCTYYYNTQYGPSGSGAALLAAQSAWNNAGANFSFVDGGATSSHNWGSNDGSNIIDWGALSSANALAVNRTWYYTSSGRIVDSDIRFNTSYPWGTSGASNLYDVQNIGTHELGHSLQLKDLYSSSDSDKTMYGYGSAGETKKRTLTSDDIAGIKAIYGESSGGGGGTSGTILKQGTFGVGAGQGVLVGFDVPSGATNLTVSLTNVTGDPDLYLGYGYIPSRTTYDYRSVNGSGQDDTISIDNPRSGTWISMVYGYTAATLTYTAQYTGSSSGGSGSSQWGVVDYVCCSSGGVVGFWGQIGSTIKGSALSSCSATPTWEGYASTTSGTHTFSYWTYVACGSGPTSSESVTLEADKCYEFRLRYSNGWYIQQLEVSGCADPTAGLSTADGDQEPVVVKEWKIDLPVEDQAINQEEGLIQETVPR